MTLPSSVGLGRLWQFFEYTTYIHNLALQLVRLAGAVEHRRFRQAVNHADIVNGDMGQRGVSGHLGRPRDLYHDADFLLHAAYHKPHWMPAVKQAGVD